MNQLAVAAATVGVLAAGSYIGKQFFYNKAKAGSDFERLPNTNGRRALVVYGWFRQVVGTHTDARGAADDLWKSGWDVTYTRVGPFDDGGLDRIESKHFDVIVYLGHASSGYSGASFGARKLKNHGFSADGFLSGACYSAGIETAVSSGLAPVAWGSHEGDLVECAIWSTLFTNCWGSDWVPGNEDDPVFIYDGGNYDDVAHGTSQCRRVSNEEG